MITTESSNSNALRMAKLLIQNKLAACVSIKQIFSIYKWNDNIEETKEFEITIKSKLEFKDCLIDFVNKNKITCVVDATHPFAVIISKNLNNACKEINTPLLLFERKSLINNNNNFFYIDDLKDINNVDIENKNILLAIGSRFLNDTAGYYMNCKANVFTRVLPTYEGITKAFGSCIKNSNIAILEPSKNNKSILEKKLCDFW